MEQKEVWNGRIETERASRGWWRQQSSEQKRRGEERKDGYCIRRSVEVLSAPSWMILIARRANTHSGSYGSSFVRLFVPALVSSLLSSSVRPFEGNSRLFLSFSLCRSLGSLRGRRLSSKWRPTIRCITIFYLSSRNARGSWRDTPLSWRPILIHTRIYLVPCSHCLLHHDCCTS